MNIKTVGMVAGAVVGLVTFAGCARYKAKSLKRLGTKTLSRKQSVISFAHHIFDKNDCKTYLDRNVIAKGYQPVHLTITNNTHHYLEFSTKTFSFPCEDVQEVTELVHTNTLRKVVGYGVPGLVLWPLLIPAVVDGVKSTKANMLLDADFSRKALRSQRIAPYATINGLIFVPVELFTPDFKFVVTDITTQDQYELSAAHATVHTIW